MNSNNDRFFVGAVSLGVDLRPGEDGKPVEDSDPRDHSLRRMEFQTLGGGCRKARRLPTLA